MLTNGQVLPDQPITRNRPANQSESTGAAKERLCISVPEAAKLLGISRGLAYQMAQCGKLPAVRFGRRLLVPRGALERMLNEVHDRGLT